MPLVILATGAALAGLLNAEGFHWEKFTEWVQPRVDEAAAAFPKIVNAPFEWGPAMGSFAIAAIGIAVSWVLCRAFYERHEFQGLTQRNRFLGKGYRFLVNKYYLDFIYENGVVAAVSGPIARAVYWTNQKIIDGFVNGVARGSRVGGEWVYRNIDQRVVDGAVNGVGFSAEGSGGLLRRVQTGKVQQYGALLFGAAAVGALILVIVV